MTKISLNDFNYYSQIVDEGTKEYYVWLRHILTLSMASLTLLVAFRSQILPTVPKVVFLLQLSWLLFAVSIVLALFALAGHHRLLFRTASEYRESLVSVQDTSLAGYVKVPKTYLLLGKIVPWFFVAAVLSLTLFGIINLNQESKTNTAILNKQATVLKNLNSK